MGPSSEAQLGFRPTCVHPASDRRPSFPGAPSCARRSGSGDVFARVGLWVERPFAPLFEVERARCVAALVAQAPRPIWRHWPRRMSRFTANDYPCPTTESARKSSGSMIRSASGSILSQCTLSWNIAEEWPSNVEPRLGFGGRAHPNVVRGVLLETCWIERPDQLRPLRQQEPVQTGSVWNHLPQPSQVLALVWAALGPSPIDKQKTRLRWSALSAARFHRGGSFRWWSPKNRRGASLPQISNPSRCAQVFA